MQLSAAHFQLLSFSGLNVIELVHVVIPFSNHSYSAHAIGDVHCSIVRCRLVCIVLRMLTSTLL